VDPGVGTAGAHQAHRGGGDVAEGGFSRVLNTADAGLLGLPAGELRTVVLERDGNAWQGLGLAQPGSDSMSRWASCFWATDPSVTTSSRMLRAPSGSPMSM